MEKTKIQLLTDLGQSLWLDNINRSMIASGKLKKLIDQGILGLTSNPTIFNQSISSSDDYDESIFKLKEAGQTTFEIYDELTVRDIQDAADLFKRVYDATDKNDGYVSLEINPLLAHNKEESIQEGLRLFGKVRRPNLMVKVPVTDVGPDIIEELTAHGVNVNATLIFSPKKYWETVSAYFQGLERYQALNSDLRHVRSVASIFVSRIDTAVDRLIEQEINVSEEGEMKNRLQSLKGKAAVANSVVIFEKSRQMFSSNYFQSLQEHGACIQRVLWASTGTKNPAYRDIKYVTELIADPTVNTLPEKTLGAFVDHGEIKKANFEDVNQAQDIFGKLEQFGIKIDDVYSKLLEDGVHAFSKSFQELLNSIEAKAKILCAKI
ncbi:MAG: transaldolase [Candidatus Omnitrophota bacterium]